MKTFTSPFYLTLRTGFALRQTLVVLLWLSALPEHVQAKPHHRAHLHWHVTSTQGVNYGNKPEVIALADELAHQYTLPKAWVREQISKAQYLKGVPKMVLPPTVPTAKNWRAYRERFIESRHIEAGTQFWKTYQSALTRAEQTYGVPAEMIVGIIGVETGGFKDEVQQR
ncbi:lytic murein transglycosylase [Limnohabitans sp.]|uniref:lytic murein transglycosylase n=1 Tax=Limnohabitans sp. TaxID=1907725 RepID=UPI00286EC721|nr:lytic murein transglycosylase [Limnohabitans sp.]